MTAASGLGGAGLFGGGGRRGDSMAHAPMGERTKAGRYKMPLLPGEEGPASGGDWVPGGLQSMTNLASSVSDTRALGVWEIEQGFIGVGLHPELAAELRTAVWGWRDEGVDFQTLRNHPAVRTELARMVERAKDISGANAARDAGIVRHDVWEVYGKSGGVTFSGTEQINGEIAAMRAVLDAHGFDIVPNLCERTVRNVAVKAAGRFDNIVMHRRTGRYYMADLKTKRKPFWTWLEMDAQLAGYANSEYMIDWDGDTPIYIDGPRAHVDLTEGVILHMPSGPDENGKWVPRLRRADLVAGWRALKLAREVCDVRSYGRSRGREAESYWDVEIGGARA